ncbi:fumarylacetoacetate hydrolase family protein [Stutzerimonas stutzeri]|uniref:fumarylacetoacetate hydrolase family protein n=1 Tax=Stutzerimonas stutzeri TaxID=316 RepID=UPI0021089BD7|nr:fumarylacetoacetate hydrolase family protein [Stutzerimonas stutzeri]MCQ4261095.1 fumarylacetoacetate hydrolase family protein [Stutzerimonas stutzeri]
MKLATLKNGSPDGRLIVVARDLGQAVDATAIAPTMQQALEHWDRCAPELNALYRALNVGDAHGTFIFDPAEAMAPLPRAYQFVDASAFLNHGNIMERAFKLTVDVPPGVPILIQRQGDDFRGPCDDYAYPSEADNCDFEGEIAAITGPIPMGADPARCEAGIHLLALFNDVSMRAHLPREMGMGFGFIQAKPATVFAPVAVTPDELGVAWQDGRVALDLEVSRNGEWFGHPNGREMDFSFGQLLSHLAYNRNLGAGTVLGTGTFSNRDHKAFGSSCLAERRALEMIEHGAPQTPFIRFGERLRFEMRDAAGHSLFGAIDNRYVAVGE